MDLLRPDGALARRRAAFTDRLPETAVTEYCSQMYECADVWKVLAHNIYAKNQRCAMFELPVREIMTISDDCRCPFFEKQNCLRYMHDRS